MHKIFWSLLLGLAIGAGATWLVLRANKPASASAKSEPTAAANPVEAKKENPLHITQEKRTASGITLVTPTTKIVAPEIDAFGRVLDPSTLVSAITDLDLAQSAAAVSEKELQRVRQLHEFNGNASTQALDAAEAAAARDRTTFSAAKFRLAVTWGKAVADSAANGSLKSALVGGASLVRIDVLGNGPLPANLKTAEVSAAGSTNVFAAEVLGPAPAADPQIQGLSFLALVHEHVFPFGSALNAKMPTAGEAKPAFFLPRSAIIYHQGSAWVYVLGEEDTFERKLISLGSSRDSEIAVLSGISGEEQVVATGAEQILAAELQAGESAGDD